MNHISKFLVVVTFIIFLFAIASMLGLFRHVDSDFLILAAITLFEPPWGWLVIGVALLSLVLCIRDCQLRMPQNGKKWIIYMLLTAGLGMFHYFVVHGRRPRQS